MPKGNYSGILLMNTMKTAISMEDDLLAEADRAAKRIGVSRSRFLSLAVRDYLARHRQEQMTQRLNEIYCQSNAEDARLTRRMKAKFRQAVKDSW
jgi:metal-responsive CopG/Arc/MetJ family transcriptional regulator